MAAVVVAVNESRRSRRAVRWALDNFPPTDRLVLVHVTPPVLSIPTPSGRPIPIEQMNSDVTTKYLQDMKLKAEEVFLPFEKLCQGREIEKLLLEDQSPAVALLKYASESGGRSLVLGSSSFNCILRKLKGQDLPATVLKLAPNNCNIYLVLRKKVLTRLSEVTNVNEASSTAPHCSLVSNKTGGRRTLGPKESDDAVDKAASGSHSFAASACHSTSEELMEKWSKDKDLQAVNYQDSSICSMGTSEVIIPSSAIEVQQFRNERLKTQTLETYHFADALEETASIYSQATNLSDVEVEVEKLKTELKNTLTLYHQACEELVNARSKAHLLSVECSEETRKVKDAQEREEISRRKAEEERAKYLETIKEVEETRQVFAREAFERQRAEMSALRESSERKKMVDSLLLSDTRYRKYSRDEIDAATEGFSEAKKIGEGGYGKVYKCTLDHTPVAVKVLRLDAPRKKEEFLKEVEILCQLRHPNVVLLLGACPENGCLVYEYMDNGSLEDRLFCINNTPPIPWLIRFQIISDVARGLAYLHGIQPDPIVHRDLKPGNILLDSNYGSKIGDVGLAKFLSNIIPDGITEYHDTMIAGTLFYMDPEYQRTGTIRPKSDLYALGVIIFQLLTGKHPAGLVTYVENAVKNGTLRDILDKSITNWPFVGPEKLAQLGLKCTQLRCRDRPDIGSEVIPQLEQLVHLSDGHFRLQQVHVHGPSHYFCPILQELMEDPYIAPDGFTYEYIAIKKWLEKHSVSPVTKLRLPHNRITPNHTMRSAIQEWKQRSAVSRC